VCMGFLMIEHLRRRVFAILYEWSPVKISLLAENKSAPFWRGAFSVQLRGAYLIGRTLVAFGPFVS
jgi:hypothetical protein